jgi:hypothetical protein
MTQHRSADGETPETLSAPISESPDTEIGAPLTPVPSTESIDVIVPPVDSPTDANRPVPTLASPDNEQAKAPTSVPLESPAKFVPDSRRATAAQVTAGKARDGSNTTLQSMMHPEPVSIGVPQSRRFLSIERELEQCGAAIRLLKKEQMRLQRDARSAWIIAGVALLLAGAAIAL